MNDDLQYVQLPYWSTIQNPKLSKIQGLFNIRSVEIYYNYLNVSIMFTVTAGVNFMPLANCLIFIKV